MDSFFGMYQNIQNSLKNYELEQSGKVSPQERVLLCLEAPYNHFRNHDQFSSIFKQILTEEEAEVWFLYPDFDYHADMKTPAEVMDHCDARLKGRLAELSASLANKYFLAASQRSNGETEYMRTSYFELVSQYLYCPDGSALGDAILQWWLDIVDNGDSAQLREPIAEYRVLPHEGTLTGDEQFGKISMNMEIPDHREILTMDQASQFLKVSYRYGVTRCVCRTAKDLAHTRTCDFPLEVCILFDEAADAGIAAGIARESSLEEVLDIIRKCRDMGMTQIVSDAEHPLALCNCCECCCVCMNSLKRFERTVAHPSRFRAEPVHREACIGCGTCVKICEMDAPAVEDGVVRINTQKCIGCGECVSRCPKGVLKMKVFPGESRRPARGKMIRPYI